MTDRVRQISPKRATRRILRGSKLRMHVRGDLDLSGIDRVTKISSNLLSCHQLMLSGCQNLVSLPENLVVHELHIQNCTALTTLPRGLKASRVYAGGSGITAIPATVEITERLDLTGCTNLTRLPERLRVQHLIINDCTALEMLPDGLEFSHLEARNCTRLQWWGRGGVVIPPEEVTLPHPKQPSRRLRSVFFPRSMELSNCPRLRDFPDWVNLLNVLDVRDCPNLRWLPPNLKITHWIELGNSGLEGLSRATDSGRIDILWNNVLVDERIAFRPDKLTAREVLAERNLERRRIMLERMGYRRFFEQADADLIDLDEDAGGERQLLRMSLPDRDWQQDEPIVCLAVNCPSTGRRYALRVPPHIRSCHAAAAWLAGFDDPSRYDPLAET